MAKRTKRLKGIRLAAAAAVWSIVSASPAKLPAQPGDAPAQPGLLDAVNGFVDRLDRVFDYQMAPDFEVKDLYGHRLALGDYMGRIQILSFIDQKNEDEARAWLSDESIDYMGDPDIVFVNVLYPGHIPFIVSRGNAIDSIQREVDKFLEEMWQGLSATERDLFQKTTIRWVVDWKRDLQRAYNATRDRVTIVVVDPQGRIREVLRQKTPKTVEELRSIIAELKAAKGPNGLAQK